MSKIAIISQPDEGLLIDISGCSTLNESLEQLSSTLQASSQFWKGLAVSLNLGSQELESRELQQILAIAKGVGIVPKSVYTTSDKTKSALSDQKVALGEGEPMALPRVSFNPDQEEILTIEIDGGEEGDKNAFASLKVKVKDAIKARRIRTNEKTTKEENLDPIEVDARGSSIEAQTADTETSGRKIKSTRKVGLDGRPLKGSSSNTTKETSSNTAVASTCDLLTERDAEAAGEKVLETSEASEESSEFEGVQKKLEEHVEETHTLNTLYLKQTLRSGQTVSHKGNLIVIGDINPGAEVMAEGDITVWGSLRGIAHAGIAGNTSAEIRALSLQPIQIRIANAIARAPDNARLKFSNDQKRSPETARLVDGKIRVSRSNLE